MEFLRQLPNEQWKYEFFIDWTLFHSDIAMKAAYNFLEDAYFFFRFDENKNIILQITLKPNSRKTIENVIGDLSDEILSVYLRNKLEIDNKDIREKIVWAAIANSIDKKWFVALNTDKKEENTMIDFDRDIDEILKEIENDPDLKIDEEEIARILKEIEEETGKFETSKPQITLNPNAIKDVKAKFQDR